jgi:hypothetical protein
VDLHEIIYIALSAAFSSGHYWGWCNLTSVRKRLDHVLSELESMGTETNEEASNNVIAELKVINGAYRETKDVPMCCFRYNGEQKIICDIAGPLEHERFMEKCRECQDHIKKVLVNLKTN